MLQDHIPILPSNVEELQKLVTRVQASMSQKEQENMVLREQIRQFEARWSEHEMKMKTVEETWQRQTASLQVSLPFYPYLLDLVLVHLYMDSKGQFGLFINLLGLLGLN